MSKSSMSQFLVTISALVILAIVHEAKGIRQNSDASSIGKAKDGAGLELTLYSESLCPFCREFITQRLAPLFKSGISDLVTIKVQPWGNARYNSTAGTWVCQHGGLECEFNVLQSCAIHYYPEQDVWFPYINCIEELTDSRDIRVREIHEKCSQLAGLDATNIWGCAKGDEGVRLQEESRKATDALSPSHAGVPWVTMTGHVYPGRQAIPLYGAIDIVKTLICAAYAGQKTWVKYNELNHGLPKECFEEEPPAASIRLSLNPGRLATAVQYASSSD